MHGYLKTVKEDKLRKSKKKVVYHYLDRPPKTMSGRDKVKENLNPCYKAPHPFFLFNFDETRCYCKSPLEEDQEMCMVED